MLNYVWKIIEYYLKCFFFMNFIEILNDVKPNHMLNFWIEYEATFWSDSYKNQNETKSGKKVSN